MTRLTKEELSIINMLSESYNKFIELNVYHPNENSEYAFHIHALQNIIMSRLAVRQHKDLFRNESIKIGDNKND